jgi:hypothetical protein
VNVVCEDDDMTLLLLLLVMTDDDWIGDELFVNLRSKRYEKRCNGIGWFAGSGD